MKVLGQPLESIQALCDAAPGGPWEFLDDGIFAPKAGVATVWIKPGADYYGIQATDGTRAFVAQSRTLLPALAAKLLEAERLLRAAVAADFCPSCRAPCHLRHKGDCELTAFLETDA